MSLIDTMNLLNRLFSYGKHDSDRGLWCDILEKQLVEARKHIDDGRHDKYLNELADLILVSWNAIEKGGRQPEKVLMDRIETRILPSVESIIKKYKEGYENGRKESK